jgi:hypothetical protein
LSKEEIYAVRQTLKARNKIRRGEHIEMKDKYAVAPMDHDIKWRTYIVLAAAAVFVPMWITSAWQDAVSHRTLGAIIAAFASILVISFLISSWRLRPTGYEVDNDSIHLLTTAGETRILLSAVTYLRRFEMSRPDLLRWWLLGWTPFAYTNPVRTGRTYKAITDRTRTVLIVAETRYLISPADPDAFVGDMQTRLGRRR